MWTSAPTGAEHRVLPDGCMDIIWSSDGQLLVAGPDTTAFMTGGTPGTTITAIRFPPGLAPAVLRVPAHELRDRHEALDAVVPGREARRLADRLAAAEDPAGVLEALAIEVERDPQIDLVTVHACRGASVSEIARAVDMSPRHLHRRCLDAFGYGAKTLARILRMRQALDLVLVRHRVRGCGRASGLRRPVPPRATT